MNEAVAVRGAVEQALIQKSLQDGSFRRKLLADPKAIIEQELGSKLPEDLKVQVLEETQDTIYLVLPPAKALGELSDLELDAVAGAGATGPLGSRSGELDYATGPTGPTGTLGPKAPPGF